jgi:hypothetical protein
MRRRTSTIALDQTRREMDLRAQKQACDEFEAYLTWRLKTLVAEGVLLERTLALGTLQLSA